VRSAGGAELLRELAQVLPVHGLPETARSRTERFARSWNARRNDRNNDLWIAAHAKAAGLTLVTNNEREFRRVRGLKVQKLAV